MKVITNTELNNKNLIRAINTRVIPVPAYPVNVFIHSVRISGIKPNHQKGIKEEKHAWTAVK